jgi:hypothetical protein
MSWLREYYRNNTKPLLVRGITKKGDPMKIKEITIFTMNGLETLDRKTFIENLDLGVYDGMKVEIIEAKR